MGIEQTSTAKRLVLIDSCAVDRLAESGIDPVGDLRNSEFVIAYSPDLKVEYRLALAKPCLSSEKRKLFEGILAAGSLCGFFGFSELGAPERSPCLGFDAGVWAEHDLSDLFSSIKIKENKKGPVPRNRTDSHLVAFAKVAIVITDDKGPHWNRVPEGEGLVIQWSDLKKILERERNLASAIRRVM